MSKRKVGVLGDTLHTPPAKPPAYTDATGRKMGRYTQMDVTVEVQTEHEKNAPKPPLKTSRRNYSR